MVLQGHRIVLFSDREYSVEIVRRLLRQVGNALGRRVTLEEWLSLD